MGFLTRLIAGFVAASTLGAGLAGTANAVDAAGAASDTTGAVTTTADDTGGRTVLDCRQSGEGATGPYADKFCWIDWSNLPLDSSGKPTPVRINVPGGHIDADATITHTDNAALAAKDYTGSKWSRLTSAYKLTGNTALAFSGRMGRQDPAASVTFSNVTPSADRTDTGVNVLKDFQLAFGDAEVMSGGVLQGHDVYERTDIESDKTLEKLGLVGSGDPNQSYSKANTGYGTTHVTLAGGPKGATDDANKDSKGAAVVGAKQASRFKVSFGQVNQHWDGWGSAIAVGVYMPYLTAYPLTYDKNSSDASGQVPSNQRGKENTTQPAKTKTNGTVKTVADTNASLPDHLINGDFSVNYHDQWKDSFDGWTSIDPNAGKTLHVTSLPNGFSWKWTAINGWDKSKFGWTSTQKAGSNVQQKANAVELQYDDSTADNVYAELCAYEADTAIYQDIRTVPGTLYKVRLKHASLNSTYLDKMQVMIGTPGHEQPVEMTRTSVNGHGDKLNEKSTTIATKVTNGNNRHHANQWETYEGTYLIPAGQTVTRFTFKSIDSKQLDYGNVLDDIVFDKAYRLDYDKNASDATGEVPSNQRGRENTTQPAKDKTSGTVRLASDDDVVEYAANGLPKQLVNSDFDHDWRNIVGQSRMSAKYNFANVDPAHGDVEISGPLNGKGEASKQWVHLNGFDANKFGWKSNQTDTRVDGRGGIVEIQRSRANDNMYAEITASQANTYLYQDIDTAHSVPTVYTVKLRYAHRNGTINSNEKIQILVGAPGHEQPVTMTRIASSKGNRIGEKSTTVNAPNTNGWLGSWDTFQGSVVVPAGQNVSRFTFKALGSIDGVSGNLIDDVQFKLAYRLSYDKNSQDASGQVPSDETANTVKQTKARTTGTVRAVADDVDGLPTELINGDFQTYGNEAINRRPNYELTFVDGSGNVMTGKDINGTWGRLDSWDSAKFGWKSNDTARGHSSIVEVQRPFNTPSTSTSTNVWGEIAAASQGKYIYQDIATTPGVMYKWSIKHASRNTARDDSMQVLIGEPGEEIAQEATRTTSNGSDKTGKVGTMITTHGVAQYGQWETYTGTYIATSTVTRFTFKSVTDVMAGGGSDSAEGNCIDDVMFMKAYKLTYDKNAADATGSVPSNTTPGTTQTVSSRTEGKVSDLVQRTTTHEDGSVTVRTVDTTTDVVSGCQVYYPAGQKITLATMAKDDDCWDSSMLSRPGHTQLGWNQDRNATQAQAQVTMVEGGMTVFAVWVGNPVLTYDTNKPSTWGGQMPSTPASVSVPYNTAAADGSGWRSGDTTMLKPGGYKFLGWYTGPQDNAGLYDWNTLLTGNVTVYAHWQRLQANVIYNANGGTGSHPNTTGWQYSDVTIPSDTSKSFKRDGYYFKYWNTQKDGKGTTYKDGGQVPLQDKDVTLYAIWAPYHTVITETGGVGLPVLVAAGMGLLVVGIGSTVMLTRRMRGEQ